jgi:hypothetical protein
VILYKAKTKIATEARNTRNELQTVHPLPRRGGSIFL